MNSRVLVIKMNLLPWYNELDDVLEVQRNSFPTTVRERLEAFGEYRIVSINRLQTRLRRIRKEE